MKKRLLFSVLLIGGALSSQAYKIGDEIDLTPTIKGYVTYVNGTNLKVEVYANPDNKPTGDVEIPYFYTLPTYDTATPMMISSQGFKGCDITSVKVGAGIEYIGKDAFYGCTKLTSFTETTPGSVKSIGESAFYHTDSLERIELPGVYSVGQWAFNMSGIKSADFSAIEYIYAGGFYQCHNLATFTGGEFLKQLDNIAFCNDENLKYVLLGPDLKSIGSMAFAFCTSLKEVVIPESCSSVAQDAFQGLAMQRAFILSPDFMDYCDRSKLLRDKSLEKVYCPANMIADIKTYIAEGSEANNPQFLASDAEILPLSDLVEVKQDGGDIFTITPKYGDISALKVFNPDTGSEIQGSNYTYELSGSKVGLQYRVDWTNLLRYTETLERQSAVTAISAPDTAGSLRYFNLQGIEIPRPEKGIFIEMDSNGSSRIIQR